MDFLNSFFVCKMNLSLLIQHIVKEKISNKVISLFSGAGGMDIGFRDAGFEISVAVEQDPSCCKTLLVNEPNLKVIEGDINKISTNQILKVAKLNPLEPALVIGGPPCQSFSLAGKRMGLNDDRGKLILEFARVVKESLPKVFVMENVKGMLNWSGGKAIEAVMSEFIAPIKYKGRYYQYQVDYQVLNAAKYGVPQKRERLFIVGNRLNKEFVFPVPTNGTPNLIDQNLKPFESVWNGIGGLPLADEPSETAKNVSKSIKGRIKKHGY
jgi:DNA (cytosine-5)-methyltransferase 1